MDNFRQQRRVRSHSTIDGFVTPGHGQRQTGDSNFKRTSPPTTSGSGSIGNFRRPNGFQPSNRPLVTRPVSSTGRQPQSPLLQSGAGISRPLAQNQKKHGGRRRSWGKVVMRTSLTLILLLVVTGGFLFGKGYLKARQIFKGGTANAVALHDNVDPSLLKGEGEGRINILLLGIGGDGHDGPDLTDTILVASIDPINNKASLLSVPRDLWVKIPTNTFTGAYQKINAAYEAGKYTYLHKQDASNANTQAVQAGFSSIDQVVEQVLGIPIHYHVLVNFQAFRQGIDTLGGVTINAPEQLYDPTIAWENNRNPVIAKAGVQTFNGKQALLYARSRETSSDFARTQRQRAILLALKQKILTLGTFSNPNKVSGLIDAFGNNIVTDLSLNDAMRLYSIGKNIGDGNVNSVGLADPPNHYVTTGNINGISVVQPTAGVFQYGDIQAFVRNTLKDGFIANENASITVLNGTSTPGLASAKATALKAYGYNIAKVDSAPTDNYPKTVLVDLRGGAKKYTRHYLESRLGVSAVDKLPDNTIVPGGADFVIILGQNEASTPST